MATISRTFQRVKENLHLFLPGEKRGRESCWMFRSKPANRPTLN